MAKNYQIKEAYDVVQGYIDGDHSLENIAFMSRYPALTAAIISKDIESILAAVPYGSARQIEKGLRGGKVENTEDDDSEDEDVVEAPKAEPKAKKGKAKAAPEPEEDDDEDEEEEVPSKYAGKSAKQLYQACIKAGLKVKTEQSVEYYIEKLEYAEKKAAEAKTAPKTKAKAAPEPEEDSDDWDEDEDEEEAPAPAKAKAKGKDKPATAKTKGKTEESDEDGDWDF